MEIFSKYGLLVTAIMGGLIFAISAVIRRYQLSKHCRGGKMKRKYYFATFLEAHKDNTGLRMWHEMLNYTPANYIVQMAKEGKTYVLINVIELSHDEYQELQTQYPEFW